jgi:transcriptional regulator with XRE-family HTH domain
MSTFHEIQIMQKEDDLQEFIILELISEISSEREELGISQRELSKISGVPQKTISRLENGIDIPKFKTLFKLLNALNLDLEIKVSHKTN